MGPEFIGRRNNIKRRGKNKGIGAVRKRSGLIGGSKRQEKWLVIE
jgi:hypothetical protein